MILIFEQDVRPHGDAGWFNWRCLLFRGAWERRGRMWRIGWGLWSLSYYSSPGLRDFFRHVESGASGWYDSQAAYEARRRRVLDTPLP